MKAQKIRFHHRFLLSVSALVIKESAALHKVFPGSRSPRFQVFDRHCCCVMVTELHWLMLNARKRLLQCLFLLLAVVLSRVVWFLDTEEPVICTRISLKYFYIFVFWGKIQSTMSRESVLFSYFSQGEGLY